MKFTCDRCGKRYSSTDDPVPGRLYRIQCKCGHVILVRGGADGRSVETTPGPRRSGTPSPSPLAVPQPAPAPQPAAPAAPAGAAWPAAGAEPPQFDGDPFAAAPVRAAHPAATPANALDPLAGAWGAQPSAAAPEPAVRQQDPVVRQPFPEPQPFSPGPDVEPGRSSGLELESLVGGMADVPDPGDPFRPADIPGQPSLTMPVPPPPLARPGAQPGPRVDPPASQPLPMAPLARRGESSSGRGKVLAIAGGVAVVALALGAWFFLITKSPTSTTTAVAPPSAPSRQAPRPQPHVQETGPAAATPNPTAPTSPPPGVTPTPSAPPSAPAAGAPERASAPEAPRAHSSTARREERPSRREPAAQRTTDAKPPPPAPAAPKEQPPAPAAQPPAAAPQAPAPAPAAKPAKQGLESAEVLAVIRQHRAAFDACIADAVAGGAPATWLGRRVDLLVTVNPSGRVTDPLVDDVEVEPSALGACLRRTAAKMIFPSFQGEAVPVAIPLRLGKVE